MITLKDIIDKYSIEVPSWIPESMLTFNMMNCPKKFLPKVDKYYTEKNINDSEHKENLIICGRLTHNNFLYKITINSYDTTEKILLVELQTGNTKNFSGRPCLTQWDSYGKELEICY